MKKFQYLGKTVILLLAIAFATACSSDDGGSGTGGSSGSYIHAKVDGSSFKAEVMDHSTVIALRMDSGDGILVQLSGADANANAMNIILFGITEPGTYDIGPDSDSVLAYLGNSNQSFDTGECAGATGTVTITEISETKVKGTFQFTGKSEENGCSAKTISEGKFQGIFTEM